MKTFGDIFEDFLQVPSSQNFFEIELNQHTRSKRKNWAWTDTNLTRSFDIERIVMDRETYWPLTERGIFYQIYQTCLHKSHWHKNGKISNGPMKVTAVIGAITELLKWLRIGEVIPWEAIVDEQRLLTNKVGFGDTEKFIRQEMEYFLDGYKRCLAKRQPYYVEVWVEKQTLRHIIQPITDKYCLRLMCCKGYNSVTFQNHFYDRAMEAINLNKPPVVLYFGDWDPSGCNMIYAAAQTLVDEMGLWGTKFYRCGINPEHFSMIQADPVPVKPSDSRAKKFIEKYGATAYELDAFEPEDLQKLVENSILRFIDSDAIQADIEQEPEDQAKLKQIRMKVRELIKQEFQ